MIIIQWFQYRSASVSNFCEIRDFDIEVDIDSEVQYRALYWSQNKVLWYRSLVSPTYGYTYIGVYDFDIEVWQGSRWYDKKYVQISSICNWYVVTYCDIFCIFYILQLEYVQYVTVQDWPSHIFLHIFYILVYILHTATYYSAYSAYSAVCNMSNMSKIDPCIRLFDI